MRMIVSVPFFFFFDRLKSRFVKKKKSRFVERDTHSTVWAVLEGEKAGSVPLSDSS